MTGHFDAAAVGIDDGFAYRQTQSEATIGTGARFVGAVKTLEDVGKIFGGDSLAGVGDGQHGAAVFRLSADANFAVRLVVVDGVGKEVRDDLGEAVVTYALANGFTIN